MSRKITAVPVNESGSRGDVAGAKPVPRVQEVNRNSDRTQVVLDGPSYNYDCNVTTADGTKCGNKLVNPTQQKTRRCLGHMTGKGGRP